MTRINERSWCEQFIRLRRFIFSKATINIFDLASKWNNTSKIYIYIILSKYFFRWSIYFRPPFSSSICHSLPPRFFPRLSFVSPFASISRLLSVFFRQFFENCIYIISQHRKFRWFENGIIKRANRPRLNEFFSRVHKRDFSSLESSSAKWQYLLFIIIINFYPRISNYSPLTTRWSSLNNNNVYIFFSFIDFSFVSITLWKQISRSLEFSKPPPLSCAKIIY